MSTTEEQTAGIIHQLQDDLDHSLPNRGNKDMMLTHEELAQTIIDAATPGTMDKTPAQLVGDLIELVRREEREACAEVAESWLSNASYFKDGGSGAEVDEIVGQVAIEIRARK